MKFLGENWLKKRGLAHPIEWERFRKSAIEHYRKNSVFLCAIIWRQVHNHDFEVLKTLDLTDHNFWLKKFFWWNPFHSVGLINARFWDNFHAKILPQSKVIAKFRAPKENFLLWKFSHFAISGLRIQLVINAMRYDSEGFTNRFSAKFWLFKSLFNVFRVRKSSLKIQKLSV